MSLYVKEGKRWKNTPFIIIYIQFVFSFKETGRELRESSQGLQKCCGSNGHRKASTRDVFQGRFLWGKYKSFHYSE